MKQLLYLFSRSLNLLPPLNSFVGRRISSHFVYFLMDPELFIYLAAQGTSALIGKCRKFGPRSLRISPSCSGFNKGICSSFYIASASAPEPQYAAQASIKLRRF